MSTLLDLNNFADGSITYTDARPSTVIFNFPNATDIDETITTESFTLRRSIDIVEIVQPLQALVTFVVDVSAISGAYVQWGTLPSGVTKSQFGQVYTIQGIDSVSDWLYVRTPTIYIPTGSQGSFEYTCSINYTQDGSRKSKTWTVGSFKPIAEFSVSTSLTADCNVIRKTQAYLQSSFTMTPIYYLMLIIGRFTMNVNAGALYDGPQSLTAVASVDADPWFLTNFQEISSVGTFATGDQWRIIQSLGSPYEFGYDEITEVGVDSAGGLGNVPISEDVNTDGTNETQAHHIENSEGFMAYMTQYITPSNWRLRVRKWVWTTDSGYTFPNFVSYNWWSHPTDGGVNVNNSYGFYTEIGGNLNNRGTIGITSPKIIKLDGSRDYTTYEDYDNYRLVLINYTRAIIHVFQLKNDGGAGSKYYLNEIYNKTVSGVSDFYRVAASQDYFVASRSGSTELYVWSQADGSLLRTITLSNSNSIKLRINNNRLLVINTAGNEVFDLSTGSQLFALNTPTSGSFPPDGDINDDWIVIGDQHYNSNAGQVLIYKKDGTLWQTISGSASAYFGKEVALSKGANRQSRDTTLLISGSSNGWVYRGN